MFEVEKEMCRMVSNEGVTNGLSYYGTIMQLISIQYYNSVIISKSEGHM